MTDRRFIALCVVAIVVGCVASGGSLVPFAVGFLVVWLYLSRRARHTQPK